MSEQAHTPGPWVAGWNGGLTGPTCPVSKPFVGSDEWLPIACGQECIAVVATPVKEWGVKGDLNANARLISAAPELLACAVPSDLEDAADIVEAENGFLARELRRQAAAQRAAIAKATQP